MDAFIDDHKQEHGVEPICTILAEAGYKITPSSYYARKSRRPSAYGVRKTWKAVL